MTELRSSRTCITGPNQVPTFTKAPLVACAGYLGLKGATISFWGLMHVP